MWTSRRSESDPDLFHLQASERACVGLRGNSFFMGGVGMAAAIAALETWSDKPLLWATIQFIDHGLLGDEFDLQLDRIGGGRRVVQAGARLKRGDEILQNTIAALGTRDGAPEHQFAAMPDVPAPQDCDAKPDEAMQQAGNLIDQFERRTVMENRDAGIEQMWIRPRFETSVTAPLLALMSDFFLGAHPRSRGGSSLDNTFRLCATRPTDWVLAVTHFSSFTNGAVHGTQHQFAQDGTLLSVSSQTGLLPRQ